MTAIENLKQRLSEYANLNYEISGKSISIEPQWLDGVWLPWETILLVHRHRRPTRTRQRPNTRDNVGTLEWFRRVMSETN